MSEYLTVMPSAQEPTNPYDELKYLKKICALLEKCDRKTQLRMMDYILDRIVYHPIVPPLPKQSQKGSEL